MNQPQAETHEQLFKYFGNFIDILRETTQGSVLVTGISHTIQFSHLSRAGFLTTAYSYIKLYNKYCPLAPGGSEAHFACWQYSLETNYSSIPDGVIGIFH
jgi:hypothetical protein